MKGRWLISYVWCDCTAYWIENKLFENELSRFVYLFEGISTRDITHDTTNQQISQSSLQRNEIWNELLIYHPNRRTLIDCEYKVTAHLIFNRMLYHPNEATAEAPIKHLAKQHREIDLVGVDKSILAANLIAEEKQESSTQVNRITNRCSSDIDTDGAQSHWAQNQDEL